MINMRLLEEVVLDQLEYFRNRETGIPREIDFDKLLKTMQITVISGIRRSGKSTLLSQLSRRFKDFYYINMDDERLIDFAVDDFKDLMVVFQKLYPSKVIFIDEIQNVSGWERFVRRVHDEGYKIFLTGSNAKLLSSELATHLTGRHIKIELYPFSFREYLSFRKIDYSKMTSRNKALILKHFDVYLKEGGFPEFIKYGDVEFLKRIYDDILYRDLIVRFKIKETKAFKQLASYLFTNLAKEASYNSLKGTLGFKSVTSVKNYMGFMEECFLLFELPRFDHSLKKQIVTGKKVYVIDNGIRNNIAFYFSEDEGRLLENLVFIELKRRGKEIYYFKGKRECDFLIREKTKIVEAIQVSRELGGRTNMEREAEGLLEALDHFNLKTGTLLTRHQKDIVERNGFTINIIPVWEWLFAK